MIISTKIAIYLFNTAVLTIFQRYTWIKTFSSFNACLSVQTFDHLGPFFGLFSFKFLKQTCLKDDLIKENKSKYSPLNYFITNDLALSVTKTICSTFYSSCYPFLSCLVAYHQKHMYGTYESVLILD